MLDAVRMHNRFDSEWDYCFAMGLRALHAIAVAGAGKAPTQRTAELMCICRLINVMSSACS